MGNSGSLSFDEANKLSATTKFSVPNIKKIHKRFQKLDKVEKGYVSQTDFSALPEINKSNLGNRITTVLTKDDGKEIEFTKFLQNLSSFHYDNTKDKYKFLFLVYDVNQDGFVDQNDLHIIMKMIIGSDLPDQQISEIVEKTISDMDEDKDGKLNFEEFSKGLNLSIPKDI